MNKNIDLKIIELIASEVSSSDKNVENLIKKLNGRIWLFSFVPFVRQVAVCNNLSFGVSSKNSDIDLFFILDSKRFFSTRIIITCLLHIFGWRRHNHKIDGRFCLSFFITEESLNLKDLRLSENDYYFECWIRNLIFLKNENLLVQKFRLANKDWIAIDDDYLSKRNSFVKKFKKFNSNKLVKKLENLLSLDFFNFIENFLRNFQLNRANKKFEKLNKPTGVVISSHILKFHDKDRRMEYNDKIRKLI